MLIAQLVRQVGGTRLTLPGPVLAWICLILGGLLIAVGTAGAIKVRRHMVSGEEGFLGSMLNRGVPTLGYLLHDYDESDKWLILLGLVGRVLGGLLFLWGLIGLAWTP